METILIPAGIVVGFLVFAGLVTARLYRRTSREMSLVRTGLGGKTVIVDGGALVLPLFHEIAPVNMKTLRLEVSRTGEAALITKDRMRVDVGVEFYVSVVPTEDGISRAAQTLGHRTFDVEQLRDMIEGKLIDGLRAVAAQMTMDELHENRSDFVQEVQNAVTEDLLKNGLGLESVSLTALDQTPFEALDENNAFNAVGMRKLAEVIARSKKERAEIDADAEVAVKQAAMEAAKRSLEIERDEEAARIAQIQELQTLQVAQEAELARRREDSTREQEAARVEREQAIRSAEIDRDRAVEVAEQERQIIVNQKSEEESRARASADAARAEATRAKEAIETARATEEAERQKRIAIIEAQREAEREAVRITLAATAEKDAANDRAEARREEARAEADAVTIKADAKKADMLAEAEGREKIVAAENALSDAIIQMKLQLARLEAMPGIVEQMVKPAEKIDSIRIHQVGGLGQGQGAANEGGKPVVNQALDSIMGMAVQMPALRKLGEELGLSMEKGLTGLDLDKAEGSETSETDDASSSQEPKNGPPRIEAAE
ncbi:MAG: flotillin domain-containing protein [Pseudomonadota bacterium]